VINIITKEPAPGRAVTVGFQTSYGEFDTFKNRASVSGTKSRTGYLLSLTADRSGGFIDHTDYEQDAVYAKVFRDVGETGRVSFIYSYDEGENGDPLTNFPDFYDEIYRKRSYQRLMLEMAPADNLMFTLEGRHQRFESFIEDVFSDRREVFSDYVEKTWGGGARLTWEAAGMNTFNAGVDADDGLYDWNNFDREYKTRTRAVYANDTVSWDRYSFNAGIRYDDSREFGSAVSPSGGLVVRLPGEIGLVRGQVARGFSAPPASWIHDPNFGNPALDPETAVNYQLGLELGFWRFVRLEVNVFRADVKDLIRYNFDTRRYENIDEAKRRGVEGAIGLTFDSGLSLFFSGSYVDVRDAVTDRVIEDIPRTTYQAAARYSYCFTTHSLTGRYIDHNSTFPETKDERFIFDYQIRAELPVPEKWGRANFFAIVYNLLDTDYLYREVWPKPGRWIEAGVEYRF